MHWQHVKNDWEHAKAALKAEWGKLTDHDLDAIDGDRERLEEKLRNLYGYEKDEVHKKVHEWAKKASWGSAHQEGQAGQQT